MSDPRRRLPAVHDLVREAEQRGLGARAMITGAVRDVLEAARAGGTSEPSDGWIGAVGRAIERRRRPSLTRVVNATGVVIHTNLGRAPLAPAAQRALQDTARYSTVEYELAEGARGSRQAHVADLLTTLTGAEAAYVTTNAAAALLLVLNSVAEGAETIVSRGELVEIGGSFRLPEIMTKSGSILVEVGTTNRTHLPDYALAVGPRTGALLKVHRSNFIMTGFVAEVGVRELVRLGARRGIPVIHDAGSGLLVPLDAYGLTGEPLVSASVQAGAVVVFSGDKLLGGPQSGIIVGPAAPLERVAGNPLARAVRPDKSILAALEATLALYSDPESVVREIPVLAMLTVDAATLRDRAARLARRVPGARLVAGTSAVGGGAFPAAALPTTLVALDAREADVALARLRMLNPPVVARVEDGRIVADVRTIADDELEHVAHALAAVGASPSPRATT